MRKNIADYFKSQQRKVDINTIYNYLNALDSAFVIQRIPRYDIKGKEILQTNEKYFVSDLSLIYSVMGYRDRLIGGNARKFGLHGVETPRIRSICR